MKIQGREGLRSTPLVHSCESHAAIRAAKAGQPLLRQQ